jgi:transposase InsO family protein
VLAVWQVPRSSFYAARRRLRQQQNQPPESLAAQPEERPTDATRHSSRRLTDAEAIAAIRKILTEPEFSAEGYRKVWARLRHTGVRVWKDRVLRLMRENELLSPDRRPQQATGKEHPHDGSIIPEAPDQIWGTDATMTNTAVEGRVTIFAAIDHYTGECVGMHVVKKGDRFEALEPIRQGIRTYFGSFEKDVASQLRLRHDHGSVYMSESFRSELRFLGITPSPSFVRQPEGNGCIERFFRTLKEQLLWVRRFHDLAELRAALHQFQQRYNANWILQRHQYRTPSQVRSAFFLALSRAA